jgi:hypothetical protein
MLIVLVIVAFWFIAVVFAVALCAAARRGEDVIAREQPAQGSQPAPAPMRIAA